ncbi:hypothetical protein C0989_010195 [Termitomyces sp. Mn162]|nr:hypothetical protein C0989_010195 [Termitomyces sp. Mn162]
MYLGNARRKTAVEKILTLLLESGNGESESEPYLNYTRVTATQQGMYPTVIIILVRMHKSLWDAREMSQGLVSTAKFRAGASSAERSDEVTAAASSSNYSTHGHQSDVIAMVDLDHPDDHNSEHKDSKIGNAV